MKLITLILSEMKLISRFTIIGILATLVHLAISIFLITLSGVTLQMANLGGFIMAVGVSYTGHYHFSFKSAKDHKTALPRFLATTLTAYACNVLLIFVLKNATVLPENICLLLGVGIMPLVSFVLSRIWVY